jgi:hypothetical protein
MNLASLPRPAAFDANLTAGLSEAVDGWESLTPGRRALVELAVHAGLEIVQARLTVGASITDSELWLGLPSGQLGAIMLRANYGRMGQSGFGYTGTTEEQAETRAVLMSRLGLRGDTEPGDVFSMLAESNSRE